jgi:fibronectin type 3 domain-containing protein
MGKMWIVAKFLLVAITVSTYLSGCGGSDSTLPSAATSTAKTASWTNVSVRALDGKVNINWDKAPGSSFGTAHSTYNVYRSTNPNDIVQDRNRIQTNFTGTSFDYTNVDNGIYYYYAVTEISAAGEGPASRIVFTAPQAVLPAAPYGLKVTARDSAAELEFIGPSPPATVSISYNLYRSTARDFTANLIKTPLSTFSTPYVDSNLTNETTYYYALKSVIAGKESAFSPIASVRPQAKTAAVDSSATQLAAFASPSDMSAEPGNGFCTIRWNDVAPLVISSPDPAVSTSPYYVLYWSDSIDVLSNIKGQIDDVTVTKALTKDAGGLFTFKLSGLTNGTAYYFLITAAVKGSGDTPIPGRFTPGPVVAVTPGLKTPAVPAGVSATQGSQQVSLSWSKDSSGISGVTYNIYVSTANTNSPAELMAKGVRKNNDDSSKAYYLHSGLQAGQTYYYVITAVGEAESAPSTIVSVTL